MELERATETMGAREIMRAIEQERERKREKGVREREKKRDKR